MKSVFCVAFLALIASSQAYVIDEEDVKLTGFVEGLLNGSLNAILSTLSDPMTIDPIKLDFSNNSFVDGTFNLSTLNIAGIKNIVASYIQVDVGSMALNMTIEVPEITIITNYGADVDVASLVPLYGSGDANIKLEGLRMQVSGKASIFPLAVKNVTVILSMDNATFTIGGLLNNAEFSLLVGQMLSDNIPPFVNNNQGLISGVISGVVQSIFNSIFKGDSTDEVFEVTRQSLESSQLGQFVSIN